MARVADWVEAIEDRYDPSWAAEWDAVGLVTGDPDAGADVALLTVDVTEEVLDEAVAAEADVVVAHHPLLLRGVHGVARTTYKGRVVDRLVRENLALYVAHTNADVAESHGVSDSLARALGLTGLEPLLPDPPDDGLKLVTFVPADAAGRVLDALAGAGAGVIGDYTRCAWSTGGTGTFVAGPGASPVVGRRGEVTEVAELRVETVVARRAVPAVVSALRAAHPYEEPAFDLVPTLLPHRRGLGRIGDLSEPTTLHAFGERVAGALPASAAGVRWTGPGHLVVRRVAVCGGAGDSLADAALARGADVLVTADLRHHVTREALERGLAMVDAGHWATERPWLDDLAAYLRGRLGRTVVVSSVVTDPWDGRSP